MTRKVYIGTSGWHYKHWRGLFYPEKLPAREMFSFYARHFDTVEINNTFYHLPLPATFDNWRENSPPKFLFAVKGSRFITHMKKLKDPVTSTQKFFDGVERLEQKLGPILFQLPPHWSLNSARLTEFFEALPKDHQYVLELRDESWHAPEVYEVLRRYNVALCIHDLAQMQTPLEITSDFTYLRFHGPGEAKYCGSYSKRALQGWAEQIADWRRKLSMVYVYFNNDIGAHALHNATTLKELIEAGR